MPPSKADTADTAKWSLLLDRQLGVFSRAQADRFITEAHLRHKLARGDWRRIFRSVYFTSPSGGLTLDQQCHAAVLAAGKGAVIAGLAAALAGGLRGKFTRLPIDVLIAADRRAAPIIKPLIIEMNNVNVHRTTTLTRADIQRTRPRRTTMARAVVDAAQWSYDEEEARQVVAAACQQRKVTPAEVIAAAEAQPRAKRRALILETARYAEGGATTLTEIDFVKLCARHSLPRPDLQERRKDANGRTRYLDACWRRYRLHVEVDGSHHMDTKHWSADMLRQNEVWLKGDRVLRFPAFLVRTRPALVIEQVRVALEAAGWRP